MAVPDHGKVPSRSADRLRESWPRHIDDAGVAPCPRVLALQRTLGNRATSRLLRSRAPGRLLQRALRGKPGVLSARNGKLDERRGREILEQFARNDGRSVGDLVGNVPRIVRLDAQEWGLIRENTPVGTDDPPEVHLIFGEGGQVDWGPYLAEGTPLAHSHPWRTQEQKPMERIGDIDIADLLPDARQAVAQQDLSADEWFDKQRRVPARKIVVPTVSDFVFPATRGMTAHAVVTPYVVSDTGVVSKPPSTGGRDTARLVWELTDINLDRSSPDESKHQVTGRLTAKRGATQIWTRMVQAPASDDVEALKKTSYTVIGS